ncbi:MAG: ATP-binding protein [Gammaproteobacteria bacterium]
MTDLPALLARAERVLARVEALLPEAVTATDWDHFIAFRWRQQFKRGYLEPVRHPHQLRLRDLQRIDRQKSEMERNTRQFLAGLPANHVLLWGPRGTGKSSLIKALLNEFSTQGLRLIEVDKDHLVDYPDIIAPLDRRPEHFLIFCDDLSFEANDPSYKALKAILDGSVSAAPANVLLCATSNRRHLLPEFMSENQATHIVDGELHHGEAVEEKISLSERFGMWLSFHPFSQDDYLAIVAYWLGELGASNEPCETVRKQALEWALTRGSRSGRVAWQFARDWVGRQGIAAHQR